MMMRGKSLVWFGLTRVQSNLHDDLQGRRAGDACIGGCMCMRSSRGSSCAGTYVHIHIHIHSSCIENSRVSFFFLSLSLVLSLSCAFFIFSSFFNLFFFSFFLDPVCEKLMR